MSRNETNEKTNLVLAMMDVASSLLPIMFDNNRMRILWCLGCCLENKHVMKYTSIARATNISEGAVLNHCLNLLDEDGIVFNEKNGKYSYYGLTPLGAEMTSFLIEVVETLAESKTYERKLKKGFDERGIAYKELDSSLSEIKKSLSDMGEAVAAVPGRKTRHRRSVDL